MKTVSTDSVLLSSFAHPPHFTSPECNNTGISGAMGDADATDDDGWGGMQEQEDGDDDGSAAPALMRAVS